MASRALDPFRARPSILHGLDPRIKTVFALALILALAILPHGAWPLYILLLSVVLAASMLSELGASYLLKRGLLALPFSLAALPLLFTIPGEPWIALTLGNWPLSVSKDGAERFASILTKAWLSIQTAVILTGTTSFPGLLMALRAMGFPKLLVSIIGLTWQYLFVFSDEAARLMRARTSRSGRSAGTRLAGGTLGWRARVTGSMVGNLFLRGLARSERVYAAMLARGYDGEVRTLPLPRLSPSQRITLAISILPLMAISVLGILLWA